jgi:hypothetical protein
MHTSAYVSIRQHMSAYVSKRQQLSAYVVHVVCIVVCPWKDSLCSSVYLERLPAGLTVGVDYYMHTSAYVSIRRTSIKIPEVVGGVAAVHWVERNHAA